LYINKIKLSAYRTGNSFLIAGLGIWAFFDLLFFLFGLSYKPSSPILFMIIMMTVLTFMSGKIALIIWRSIAISKITRVRTYNSLIEEDHDGILTYDSISQMTGLPVHVIIKDLMWFTRNGYLINITLGRTALRADVMPGDTEFMTVICPMCGNHVNIRKLGGGRCDHCGTFMRAKGEQNV